MSEATYFSPNTLRDAEGDPVPGGKVRFFETGTTTPITTYADQALTTPHPVPLVADSSGILPPIWVDGQVQVKVTATDADDVDLPGYPVDPAILQSSSSSASTIAFEPTARINATNVQDAIEEVDSFVEAIEDSRKIEHTIETTGGSGNAYTVSIPGVEAYNETDVYLIKLDRSNTGSVTLNVNALGVESVVKTDDTGAYVPLGGGDWYEGEIHRVLYDGSQFVVLTPTQPTVGKKGGVRRSTTAENNGGNAVNAYPNVEGTKEMIDYHAIGGIAQTWQVVTGSRSTSTNYENDTGSPIMAIVTMTGRNSRIFVGESTGSMFVISGRTGVTSDSNATPVHSVIIPNGWYYRVEGAFNVWSELR